MNETPQYTEPSEALRYVRRELFGKKISYSHVADVLSANCSEKISKAEAWNAEHRKYKCPKHVRTALVVMGLLTVKRRWRFFYEVDEERYKRIAAWLEDEGLSFQQAIEESDTPWA